MPAYRDFRLFALGFALTVAGCGFKVPNMHNFSGDENIDPRLPSREALDENTILNHLKCEIHLGIQSVLTDPNFVGNPRGGRQPTWLIGSGVGSDLGWGAKVSFVLTADEKNQFNPGLSYKNPFAKAGTFFSLSGGLQTSAEAQRKETGAVTYSFSDLITKEAPISPRGCADQDGILIHSDLLIANFIRNKVFATRVPGTIPDDPVTIDSGPPQILNAFSDEVTFTITYGGTITPNWTFIRIATDPGGPLLGASRTKIQYASITVAPLLKRGSRQSAAQINQEGQLIDSANLLGHSFNSAIRTFPTVSSLGIVP